mgnify:CR=1 FL=1
MSTWLRRILFVVLLLGVFVIGYHLYYADSPVYEVTLSETDLKQVRKNKPSLVVDKSARRIYLVQKGDLVQDEENAYLSWPISLGKDPIGTKLEQGDQKTPEGLYTFTDHSSVSSYYGSLWINYPNTLDAKRGMKAGLLSEDQHNAITKAEKKKLRPLDDTKMGGQILIHGTWKNIPKIGGTLPQDSIFIFPRTDGCVGMSNQDIFEMREQLASTSGTVLILP